MKNYRALGLALSVVCLLAAPRAFASSEKDKDHDKDKHPAKESTPQPKSHSGSTHSSSGSGGSNSSSGQSHSSHGTSSSSDVKTGRTHETGDVRAEHPVHGTSSSDTSHNQGTHSTSSSSDSSHVRGTHNSSSTSSGHTRSASSSSSSHDPGTYHPVDHAHLHEALHAHSGQQERARAFDRSHIERGRFQRHVSAIHFVPAHRVVLSRVRIVPTTYYYRRSAFYDTYGWAPPVYVYRMYPRYGLWDAAFLAFALDHIAEEQYALMIYNHRNEAEIQQWMDDSDRLAAENDELREKLENMKLRMSKMEEQGVAVDPSYVPADAEDIALAPEVITALTTSK